MKQGFSVPTQGAEAMFAEVLAGVLATPDVSVEQRKVAVDRAKYGVDEAYNFAITGQEIGRIVFIPAGTRRNIIRVPENSTGGDAFPAADTDGSMFEAFVTRLMGQLYRQGLAPRPPRNL